MALARVRLSQVLAGRTLARPLHAPSPAVAASCYGAPSFSSAAADTTGGGAPAAKAESDSREVAVVDRSRRRWPWRDLRDLAPFRLVDGIGSALSQVAETLSRPLERLAPPSWRPLTGKVREDEERYRLRFEVPGLGKGDLRVYVEDGVLVIHGEKHEDARAKGITAEVRDGVLYVTVPRAPERKRSVTEVKVQ
ncbi:hypothetical protein E2562_032020 [Oryza meyeriana var. granulata]|uniref:SHSP domain-containing protein n=1 Tax=Oryza meyeriana var. granulata TaxID=110450 RepID=A0A6G1FED0_9ORYZ|nr:hypothetical protein E2562_032020 [Oryza meyeriana var. granulata]